MLKPLPLAAKVLATRGDATMEYAGVCRRSQFRGVRTAKIAKFHRGFLTKPDLFSPRPMMGATSLYPFPPPVRRPFDLVCTVGGVRRTGTLRGRGGGGEEGEQAEEEGCRSELERTKRSFVGALYTAELY